MQRKIIGYHLDEENDWVAELDCYHGQHVRHKPPFINRPWVLTEAGRNSKLGEVLHCVRCDQLELPDNLNAYKKTPEFTEASIPKGFERNHSTKNGTWGVINVLEGTLIYKITDSIQMEMEIQQNEQGIIPPCMLHNVTPNGKVKFYVEFYINKSIQTE